jgi:hypothetical protein
VFEKAMKISLIIFGMVAFLGNANARDLGQWENSDPVIREWFRSLMRPDHPKEPCCGEADGYYADEVHVRNGKTFATITDDRPDKPLGRPHIDIGTEIEIPDIKLKWDRSNPTGHTLVFLGGGAYGRYVFCFVQGSGI